MLMFYTICVFCTIRVWYIPYAYTRTVQPYAYGTTIRVWYSNSCHMSIANLHGSYAYNIKQKVFALPYLLTMLDGTLPSFPFREGEGASLQDSLIVVSVQ